MLILVTYDVETTSAAGRKRLRKVAKQCVNFGQRVQNSVFECLVEPAQYAELRHRLKEIIDYDKDSLRFYMLGSKWESKIEHVGAKATYNPEDPMIL
ncbi:MAG: CRISPR-associated endonuclease Cas2 [Lentimicrobium sp.]|nr:CRISPR-associated endonuclease Cas2 [Lentimicrobium sp.]